MVKHATSNKDRIPSFKPVACYGINQSGWLGFFYLIFRSMDLFVVLLIGLDWEYCESLSNGCSLAAYHFRADALGHSTRW